jgi:transketolase
MGFVHGRLTEAQKHHILLIYYSACDKVYIPDYVKNNFNTRTCTEVEKNLERWAKSLHNLKEEYGREKEQHKSRRENLVKKIRTFRTHINQIIDELENNTLKELDGELEALKNKMKEKIKELEEIRNN